MNKKLLNLVLGGTVLFAEGCFGMNPLPVALPSNPAALRVLVVATHADGVSKLAAVANPLDVPTDASLLEDQVEAAALRTALATYAGAVMLGDTVHGTRHASGMLSPDNANDSINLLLPLLHFLDAHQDETTGGARIGGIGAVADVSAASTGVSSIYSHWAIISAAFGDTHDATSVQHFQIASKANGAPATTRRKVDLAAGLTVANLTAGAGHVGHGITVRDALWLGLLANVALAEVGTLDGTQLDNAAHAPMGYTNEIRANIKDILAALH